MTDAECDQRAAQCAEYASAAASGPMAAEFMRLAGQWRAMAKSQIFLCDVGGFEDTGRALGDESAG